jgi:DMSO/TMAO reductase YedYZ heme-binding membrane subunit
VLSWLCLLLLAAALLVGPVLALRTGRVPLNHLLRRDLGIWAALNGLAHLALAFRISMTPAYMKVYIAGAPAWPDAATRQQLYMWAVIGSLVIAALFVLLLALSSNRALRLVGPTWWKRLQRGSYLAFGLTVAHAAVFQLIEGRHAALVVLLVLLSLAVALVQARGWLAVRRQAASGAPVEPTAGARQPARD